MKKMSKLTKKLFLSAIALGLAVVTLTTTTFAWYTTSATASAGTGQAGTSTLTADSSLLISNGTTVDGKMVFGPTATITKMKGLNMIPLQWKDNGFAGKEADQVVENNNYYEFTLYFKTTSEEAANVYIKSITLENIKTVNNEITTTTLNDLPQYDNLCYEKGVAGAPNDSKYAVDVVKALDMVVTSYENVTDVPKTITSYALNQDGLGTVGFDSVVDANAYYDAFMGTNTTVSGASTYNGGLTPLKLSNVTDASEIGEVPTGTESVLKVTFAIYLNGWDQYCFDACKGQSFQVKIEFTTEKAKSE